MRILWVKMGGLWPLNTGGRLRSFQILAELSRRHCILVATTHGPGDDPDGLGRQLPRCDRIISIPYSAPKRGGLPFAAALTRSWLSSYPVELWKWQVAPLRDEVRRVLAARAVDLCVADFLVAVPNVPLGGRVPVVLFEHNVEHLIWKRLARVEPAWWRRSLLEIEWRKLRRCEAQACAAASLTLTVSEEDRRRLAERAPDARLAAVPTGVDPSYFAPGDSPERRGRVVFIGSMDWYPNEDAISYFLQAVLPQIRREYPSVTFQVVGRNPSGHLRALAAADEVDVTGTVHDVRPYAAEAEVCVVPLRVAGGTRLKIFEALAMGRAVVSTTVGAEGLGLTPGVHFVQADAPAEFAAAVLALLRDPSWRQRLGAAGRLLVQERHSWAHVAREFEARCEEILASRAAAA